MTPASPTLVLTDGGNSSDLIIGSYDANTFFQGVLHGVRQPGESFSAYFYNNANTTTLALSTLPERQASRK